MIYVNIRGRAGNQMFIYALAKALKEETHQDVTLCCSMQRKERPDFQIDLEKFQVDEKISFDYNKRFPWYANNDFLPVKLARKFMPITTYKYLSRHNVFLWLEATYVPINIKLIKDAYIDGFWQSEKFFKKHKKSVLKDFKMKKELNLENLDFYEEILNSESVCVTIRRGDYLSNPENKKAYYICDEDYFQKSVKLMQESVKDAKWFVFSDDIEWAEKAMSFPGKTRFESGLNSISEKLFLMSQCKHFILSNSSFSWWAQELNESKEKIVIAPRYWYTDHRKCDIYNDGWLLVETER